MKLAIDKSSVTFTDLSALLSWKTYLTPIKVLEYFAMMSEKLLPLYAVLDEYLFDRSV